MIGNPTCDLPHAMQALYRFDHRTRFMRKWRSLDCWCLLAVLPSGVVKTRILYITTAKWRCLRLSQCAIRKYGRHVGSMIMSNDRGSIVANHDDFTIFKIVSVEFLRYHILHKPCQFNTIIKPSYQKAIQHTNDGQVSCFHAVTLPSISLWSVVKRTKGDVGIWVRRF